MLNRLRTSPWLRYGFIAVVVAFCSYGLIAKWPQAHAAMGELGWLAVVGAGLAAIAGSGCMLLAWRALLADLGSPLPMPAATRVMSVSQLGKYLPGAVWAFAAQVELASDYEVPRRRCATTIVTSVAVTLGIGLVMASVALALTSSAAAAQYWWALAIAPVILLGLCPPVLGRVVDGILALLRRPRLECRPTGRGLAKAAVWTSLGWLLWGTQAWLLLRGVTGQGFNVLVVSVGAYALAWSAGTMAIIFPGGIGPREIALIAALAPVSPHGAALVVAIVSRLTMTASDLAWAGAGLIIGRMVTRSLRRADQTAALAAIADGVTAPEPGQADPSPIPGRGRAERRAARRAQHPEHPQHPRHARPSAALRPEPDPIID